MDPTVIAIIAALAAPIGAYLVAARKFSGKIESSDAAELWAESRSIRDWSQARIEALNENVVHLEQRVAALEVSNDALVNENKGLIAEIARLETTISELRAELTAALEQLKTSRNRVSELEEHPRD